MVWRHFIINNKEWRGNFISRGCCKASWKNISWRKLLLNKVLMLIRRFWKFQCRFNDKPSMHSASFFFLHKDNKPCLKAPAFTLWGARMRNLISNSISSIPKLLFFILSRVLAGIFGFNNMTLMCSNYEHAEAKSTFFFSKQLTTELRASVINFSGWKYHFLKVLVEWFC